MELVQRLIDHWVANMLAARRVAGGRGEAAQAVWLSEGLAKLSEALLWGSPMAGLLNGQAVAALPPFDERLGDVRQRVQQLQADARKRGLVNAVALHRATAHEGLYLELLDRSERGLVQLINGMAQSETAVVRAASAELWAVATEAAELHLRILRGCAGATSK